MIEDMKRTIITILYVALLFALSCSSSSKKEEEAPSVVGTWVIVKGMGYPKTVEIDSTGNGIIDLGYTQHLYWDIGESELGTYEEIVEVHGIGSEWSEAQGEEKKLELEGVGLIAKETITLHESESSFSILDGEGKETSMVRYELDEDTAIIHYSDADTATCVRSDRSFGDKEEEEPVEE